MFLKLAWKVLWVARVAVAVVISVALFTAVAMLHSKFGMKKEEKGANAQQVFSAVIPPKPPEEKKAPQQRMRQVQQTNAEGKGQSDPMAMRFAPDLGLDGPGGGNGANVQLGKQDLNAEVFEQGQTDEDASPMTTSPFSFPEAARDQHIEGGTIHVVFVVTHEGKVGDIQISKSPSPLFDNEIKRVLATWRFKPAKNKGIPVNQRVQKDVEFHLQQ